MSTKTLFRGGATRPSPAVSSAARHAAWFHDLDSWTEYWDVYHPESRGRYYFGDGAAERGLLTRYLPRDHRPPAFVTWTRTALGFSALEAFVREARTPMVASAVLEVDALIAGLFSRHFGDAADPAVRADYLEAMHAFATDTLPAATERASRIADDDWRKATAGRHTLDGDLMWFAWALHLEAARAVAGESPLRTLMLAGVAAGCAANFAWRGHRRTRREYRKGAATASLLRERSRGWSSDFSAAQAEVHALYRIREWGASD